MPPLDNVADFSASAGYVAPGQDNTRSQYHSWFKEAEQLGEADAGGEGLKNAVAQFEGSWYVATALTMTVGFAFLMLKPEGQHRGSIGDTIAIFVFVALSLLGTINAALGVWWAGHMVPQVHWHPAAHFSKFWFATINTSLGHSQQFAKISMEQLLLAIVPLCYLYHGQMGLALALFGMGYLYFQLRTWGFLMQRMRDAYDVGRADGLPVMEDASAACCPAPHTEGLLGLISCQLLGPACFSLRWIFDRRAPWRRASLVEQAKREEVSHMALASGQYAWLQDGPSERPSVEEFFIDA